MSKKIDVVQLVGVAGTILGVGATLLSSWSNNKQMEQEIEKKVAEAVAKQLSESK